MRFTQIKRVFGLWCFWLIAAPLSLLLFPHKDFVLSGFITNAILVLLFLLSIFIARSEPTRRNRMIFVNFSIFFGASLLFHGYNFLLEPLWRMYFNQYVASALFYVLLALAIVYVTVDLIFRDFATWQRYLLTVVIVGAVAGYCYQPYILDPMYGYKTEDALNFKELTQAHADFVTTNGREPTREELAGVAELHYWKNGEQAGQLYAGENTARVYMLYPYLYGSSYVNLLMTPLYVNIVYMNVLCIGFILLFFGYQYRKDPPQGAYIDRIMSVLLLFCALEVLHAVSFMKSIEWQIFFEMLRIGQYVSTFTLLLLSMFFMLRLQFITSAKGEYYEKEIMERPSGITRWRDWLDELLIAHFLNKKAVHGRLFIKSTENESREGGYEN